MNIIKYQIRKDISKNTSKRIKDYLRRLGEIDDWNWEMMELVSKITLNQSKEDIIILDRLHKVSDKLEHYISEAFVEAQKITTTSEYKKKLMAARKIV